MIIIAIIIIMMNLCSIPSLALATSNSNTPPRIQSVEWIPMKQKKTTTTSSIIHPPRSGHIAWFGSKEEQSVFVFGGYAENSSTDRFPTNDLWQWKSDTMEWNKIMIRNNDDNDDEVPNPRLASAVAFVNGRATIFGGWDPQIPGTGGIMLDDIHEFQPSTLSWQKSPVKLPFGPTSRHVAISLSDGRALLHTHRCTDHVWIYNGQSFLRQETNGCPPSSRGLHVALLIPGNNDSGSNDGDVIIVFGGAAQDGNMSNEVFALHCDSWTWTEVDVGASTDVPSPRASPCFSLVHHGKSIEGKEKDASCGSTIVLYGGAQRDDLTGGLKARSDLWSLSLDNSNKKGQWTLLLDDNDDDNDDGNAKIIPPPRNAATLTEINDFVKEESTHGFERKCFLLHGGWNPFRTTWNEDFVLSLTFKP